MAPTVRSSSAAATGAGSAGSNTITFTLPPTINAGDLILIGYDQSSSLAVNTWPAGFTEIGSGAVSSGFGSRFAQKRATGSEGGASVTITAATTGKKSAVAVALQNAGDISDASYYSSALQSNATSGQHATPAVVAPQAGCLALHFGSDVTGSGAASDNWAFPTGTTRLQQARSTDANGATSCAIGTDGTLTSVGVATTARTLTATAAGTAVSPASGTSWTILVPPAGPTAAFTATVNGLQVALDASASTDPFAAITGYAWDYGDGTTGTGVSPTKTYTAAGTYTVTVTVTDANSSTGTTTQIVNPRVVVTVYPTSDTGATTTGWSKVPSGAASFAAVLGDNSDTTYAETGTSPSNQILHTPLPAMEVPADLSTAEFGGRYYLASGTSGSVVLALYQSGTLIKTGSSAALTSSPQTYLLALTATEAAALTVTAGSPNKWSNLAVRATVTGS